MDKAEAFWDDAPGGDIRVLASVDDGGWSTVSPVSLDFIVAPDGGVIGSSELHAMSSDRKPLARIRLHPFVIVMGAMAIASVGRNFWPLGSDWEALPLVRTLGRGLIVVGIVVLVFAYGAMVRSRTTIDPRRHTTRIVTSGIYRLSRNPIYVGWFAILLGVGMENGSLFQVAVAVVMIGLLHWAVVLREERYLEDAFGEEYLRYREGVRRWL